MGDRAQSAGQAFFRPNTAAKAKGSLKGSTPAGIVIDEITGMPTQPVGEGTVAEDWRDEDRLLSTYHAQIIASTLHAKQVDKTGRPYSEHLGQVANGVRMLGGDDDDVIAAYFHDSVEDGVATYEMLESFGVTAISMDSIRAVTKIPGEPNEVSLNRVLDAGPRAQRLKVADLLSNTRHDRVAALRLTAGRNVEAMRKIDDRLATYQRWIRTLMVELELLPTEVGHA